LLIWAEESSIHQLIKSSVIHFEIEFIHPFSDGNGRIGRLWQTLVLADWHEIFAWVPIETIVYENGRNIIAFSVMLKKQRIQRNL
jgi:Fic family protein